MSLLWRDRIQVFLAPDQVNMAGLSRGLKPVLRFRQSSVCAPNADTRQWQESLQLLEQMAGQMEGESGSAGIRRGMELQITLSNHFVRYSVIAPQPALANPDELMAYATFQMREIYGDRISDWALSLSTWDPCNGALCAAIPLALQSALEAFAQRHKVRLARIEPYLAAVLDHWSKELDSRCLWFVLIEGERFCLTARFDGVWHCIRNQQVVHNLEEELLSALEQEMIISGRRQPIEQIYVFAPQYAGQLPENDHSRQFLRLPDGKCPAPPHFPFALEVGISQDHA